MELQGLRAAMVGGASGFCQATAKRIADAGGTVAILDREQSNGKEVAEELGGSWHPCDVLSRRPDRSRWPTSKRAST